MASTNIPAELAVRAFRSLAQETGTPVACTALPFAGADAATPALVGGCVYLLRATTACWINIGTAAAAGSILWLPANQLVPLVLGVAGSTPVLHAIQDAAAGTLYATQMQDAG